MKLVRVQRFYYVDDLMIDERIHCAEEDFDVQYSEKERNELAESIAFDMFQDEFRDGELDAYSFSVEFVKDE